MTDEKTQAKQKRIWNRFPFAFNFALIMIAAVLIKIFVLDLYYVPTPSMEPTVVGQATGGERAVVNKLAYLTSDPKAGDIIVFVGPDAWGEDEGEDLLKRVIATEGETVECCTEQGQLLVDGEPLDEPYVKYNYRFEPDVLDCESSPVSRRCFEEQTVPAGHIWVMGDNRSQSSDSSFGCREGNCRGAIPISSVVGQMKFSLSLFGL